MSSPAENFSSPDKIRAEIDETRHRMDETIDALGERFKGRHLVDEALHFFRNQTQNGNMNKFKDTLTRSADSAAHSVIATVKANPIPAILIGAGVACYLYNRSSTRTRQEASAETGYGDYRHPAGSGNDFGEGSEIINLATVESGTLPGGRTDAGEGVGSRLHEVGERVRDKAHAVVEGARETGARVAERSRELYREGRDLAVSSVEQHPLQSGLICLALGLVAGIALPTSEKVRRKVRPQAQALRRRADSVVASGRQVIRSAANAAREEAKAQGLTVDSLRAKASTVSRVATDAAEKSAREQGLPGGKPAGATVSSGSEI